MTGRWSRWLRWLSIIVGGLLVLIIGSLLAVLWIPAVSQWVITEALERWDASNPARLDWRSIDGSIGGGLRVADLAVADGQGQPLLRVERAELELALWSLLGGTAEVERLSLVGVEVWADHEWGDLANPDAPVEPPTPGYGPDLPIEIVATVAIDDGRVWLDERERIELRRLEVHARGERRTAEAELVAEHIELPLQDLRVDALALAARWDSPRAYVDRLELTSPLVDIERLVARYDVEVETGELSLDADVQLDAVAERFDLDLDLDRLGERAHVSLDARGGPDEIELALDLDLGALAEVHVHAAGVPTGPTGPTDRRWAGARVRGRLGADALLAGQGPLRFELLASIRGRERQPGLVASLVGGVDDFRSGEQLRLDAEATIGSLDPLDGRATVEVRGAGIELDAALARAPAGLRGRWSLQADALARPLALAATLLEQPQLAEVRGRLDASGHCQADAQSPQSLESLECRVDLRLRRAFGFGVAVEDLRAQARIAPLVDPPALDASLAVAGLRGPSDALSFERLDATARGTLARLRVVAEGHGAHEQLRLAGAVSLGPPIDVELDRLVLRSDRGDAPVRIELQRPARVSIGDGELEIATLSLAVADGRVDLDGRLGFGPGTSSDLRLDIDALPLAGIDPLIPGPSLGGRLSLDATLTGALPEPSLRVRACGLDLQIAGLRPGDVELLATVGWPSPSEPALHRLLLAELGEQAEIDAGLRVWARARGALADHITVAAAIPLRLADGVQLIKGRSLAAHVSAESFELVELGALMPDTPSWWRQTAPDAAAPPGDPRLIPAGLVDLDITVTGPPERPRGAVIVLARRLVVDRTRLGSLLARASLDDAGVGFELTAKPGFGHLELRGRVPVDVDLRDGRIDWQATDDDHLISLDVRGLELDRLRATLGPKLPALEQALAQAQLDGTLSLALRGSGSVRDPQLLASVRAGDLRHREQALGHLRMFAAYVPGEAELELRLDGPLAQRLDAFVRAPLSLPTDDRPLHFDPTQSWRAEVHVDELSIASLGRHVGPLPIAGRLSGALELTGSLADPQVELLARVDELASSSSSPLGQLLVRAGFEHGRARVDADVIRAGAPILAAAVELPLIVELTAELAGSTVRWDQAGHHRMFATGRRIDDELLAALFGRELRDRSVAVPVDENRETELSFDLAGGGTVDGFRLVGSLDGRLASDEPSTLALAVGLELDERRQRLDLSITPEQGPALTGAVELGAAIPALIDGEQTLAEVPLIASLTASDFDLHALAGLLPRSVVDPRGRLHAQVRSRGTLGAPRLRGELMLDDAAITVVPMRQRLSEIDLQLAMSEQAVELQRLALKAGRGGVVGSGRAALDQAGDLDATLELGFEAFPLIRPGLPAMTIDTGLDLDLRRRADTTRVTAELHHPEVTVAGVTESTPDPIPSSPDVVLVGRVAPTTEPAPAPEPSAESPPSERFELAVNLREPLLISGSSIDMAWAGAIELIVDGGEVEVGGEVEGRRGRLRLFGNSFDLRRGIVTLPADGSLDPYIDLEAVSVLPEAEVTVTVRGRLSRPDLEFSANPALTEYQILTLLVTGSTEIGEGDGDVAAKAASLLAAVSNPQLQAQLNQRLGLDRVAIGFGETIDQPILTVGKRFNRDVYVETQYHHNAPEDQNTTQLAIEYTIRRRWSLEGFFGDAAVGGVGIYWTRSFPAAAWSTDLDLPDFLVWRAPNRVWHGHCCLLRRGEHYD